MNFTKTMLSLAIGSAGIMGAMSAHAYSVHDGDRLPISAGVNVYDSNNDFAGVSSGSWFAIDTDGNYKISGMEKVALSQGTHGIIIGEWNTAPGQITAPWEFFGNVGDNSVTTAITGSTEAGLNMSGWTVTWNGVVIPMGAGAWTPAANIAGMAAGPYTSGVAKFSWDGSGSFYGIGPYALDYLATVPLGHPSGFGGTKYALHLEGLPVPEVSTYGMMLAGLGLVALAVRRRERAD